MVIKKIECVQMRKESTNRRIGAYQICTGTICVASKERTLKTLTIIMNIEQRNIISVEVKLNTNKSKTANLNGNCARLGVTQWPLSQIFHSKYNAAVEC